MHYRKHTVFFSLIALLVCFAQVSIYSQAQSDKETIKNKIEEADRLSYKDPKGAIAALETLKEQSRASLFAEGIARSEYVIAKSYFTLGEPNLSFEHLKLSEEAMSEIDNPELQTDISMFRIRLFLATRKPDQAMLDLARLEDYVLQSEDTTLMIDWYCLNSRATDMKHGIAEAFAFSDRAQQLSIAYGDPGMEAVVNYTIGGNFLRKGDKSKAREYYRRSISYYESVDKWPLLLTLYTNMMTSFRGDKMYDSVLVYIHKKQAIQEMLGSRIGLLTTSESKAHLLVDMGKFEEAREQTAQSLRICKENGMDSTHSLYWMGVVHRGLDQYDVAAEYIQKAFDIAREMDNDGKSAFYAQALYQTYYWKDHFEEAFDWYQTYIQFRDSVYSERQQQEIEIYMARFETAEKEKEIMRLEKETEIEKLKRNRILGILVSTIIIGGLVILMLVYRNKRNKQIHENEKALAESRRIEAELKHDLLQKDLDLKQQELVSSMLQIARKNEFLIDIKEQISEKLDADPVTKRIENQLQREINSEEEWDKFISSFRDVHPSYIKKLGDISKGLSKSETKLACLLKMNLSSKDIANMLNISSEGIKKARYRLRKKLGLDTETDLHEYLFSLE